MSTRFKLSNRTDSSVKTITLHTTSPLFLSGANQNEAEIRISSIKGALRFWHRSIGQQALETEKETFGSTETGQSPFLLQLKRVSLQGKLQERASSLLSSNDLKYLGYGLHSSKTGKEDGVNRLAFQPPVTIELNLIFRRNTPSEIKQNILRSFRFLHFFGGLGARSRRGFGSVVLDDLHTDSIEQLKHQINQEIGPLIEGNGGESSYSMFSANSRVFIYEGENSWRKSLRSIGKVFSEFRRPKSSPSWKVKEDRQLIEEYARGGTIKRSPERAAFGLPHNYSNLQRTATEQVFIGNDRRKASPLFFHVHKITSGEKTRYPVVITYLPSTLYPNEPEDERMILVTEENDRRPMYVSPPPSTENAVDEFLTHLKDTKFATEVPLKRE